VSRHNFKSDVVAVDADVRSTSLTASVWRAGIELGKAMNNSPGQLTLPLYCNFCRYLRFCSTPDKAMPGPEISFDFTAIERARGVVQG